jgi:hypothetical protein
MVFLHARLYCAALIDDRTAYRSDSGQGPPDTAHFVVQLTLDPMMASAPRLSFLVLCAIVALASPDRAAWGQEFGRIEDTQSNVSYFFHAQPGQATVQVSLWGTVRQTGIYEIPVGTELNDLLSMAGGVPETARRKGQDAPTTYIRAYRLTGTATNEAASGSSQDGSAKIAEGSKERKRIFEGTLADVLTGEAQPPLLNEDDIIVVETVQPRRGFGWRDALSLASTLGTLTLLGLRIFRTS